MGESPKTIADSRGESPRRVSQYLGLERNVALASASVFLLGFGEELWKKFLPKYLERLGAGPGIIGLFGTAEDFFDAVYQYPGGWLADRVGRRRAFPVFIAVSLRRHNYLRRDRRGALRELTGCGLEAARRILYSVGQAEQSTRTSFGGWNL
jgi:hypothetical protein